MKRMIIVALTIGLCVGSVGAPAAATKRTAKKPVAATQEFHLRKDYEVNCLDPAAGYKDVYLLSVEFKPFFYEEDCSADHSPLAEFEKRLRLKGPIPFTARDGVPFELDATRPIVGNVGFMHTLPGGWGGVAAGIATFRVALVGKTGRREVELGAYGESFDVRPSYWWFFGPLGWTNYHVFRVIINPDPALNGRVFESLRLELECCGDTAFYPHRIEFDGPLRSFIRVPTWTSR